MTYEEKVRLAGNDTSACLKNGKNKLSDTICEYMP